MPVNFSIVRKVSLVPAHQPMHKWWPICLNKDRCQVPGSVLHGVGIASQAPALGVAAHLKAASGSGGGPADTGVREPMCVCQGSLMPGASTELGFLKEK